MISFFLSAFKPTKEKVKCKFLQSLNGSKTLLTINQTRENGKTVISVQD